jgi:hypothetical protein
VNAILLFAQDSAPAVMPLNLRLPLSIMMFLEFAIWGAWFVVLGNYLNTLGFNRKQIARVYATMPIGAIISPMFVGTLADQYLSTEHVMAASHLIGGCLLLLLSQIRTPLALFWVALAYAIVYSPTLSLVNAMYFSNFGDNLQFPTVRVLGTIGWIAAGMSLKLFIKPGEPVNNRPILLAAVLSLILGAYSLVPRESFEYALPHTPPGPQRAQAAFDARISQLNKELDEQKIDQAEFDRQQEIANEQLESSGGIPFLKAISMFRDREATIFFIGSLIIAMAMAVYFAFAALYLEQGARVKPENVGPMMTIGQWVEIIFLFTLGWFIENWGMKTVLLIGMAAWAARFGIFAARPPLLLIAIGIALHGICFDFFFAAGMIHTERIAPPGITASAQALYGVLVYGLGMWLGTEAAGWLNHHYTRETTDPRTGRVTHETNWTKFWLIPFIAVTIALVAFLVFFQA